MDYDKWKTITDIAKQYGFKFKGKLAMVKRVGRGYTYAIYVDQPQELYGGGMRDIVTFELHHGSARGREDTYRFSGWLADMETFFATDDGVVLLDSIERRARMLAKEK